LLGKSLVSFRFIVTGLLTVGMAFLVAVGLALAQRPPSTAQSLTDTLVALNARLQTAAPAERAALSSRLLGVVATRQKTLAALVGSRIRSAATGPAQTRRRRPCPGSAATTFTVVK